MLKNVIINLANFKDLGKKVYGVQELNMEKRSVIFIKQLNRVLENF